MAASPDRYWTVSLEGLSFFAYHGVYDTEKSKGNDFEVDLYLKVGGDLPVEDDLDQVVDYGAVYSVVQRVMEDRVDLLETLCRKIGEKILSEFPRLLSAKIRVSKFNPPITGKARRSFVESEFFA